RRGVEQLEARVARDVRTDRGNLWSPSDFVAAGRTLREIKAALQMLEREDAAYYLAPLQGRTVAELVEFMNSQGLSFATATSGCERHYVALHRALANELTQVRKGQ